MTAFYTSEHDTQGRQINIVYDNLACIACALYANYRLNFSLKEFISSVLVVVAQVVIIVVEAIECLSSLIEYY